MTMSFDGHAKSYARACFTQHIRESIHINSSRRDFYSGITAGRSNRVFNRLITAERLSLIPAALYDARALRWQRRGLPLFCYEFMSMNNTPDFDPERRVVPTERFEAFDWRFYRDRLEEAARAKDVRQTKAVALEGVRALERMPNYYCMLRHILESVYRFAYFVPLQDARASELGLPSPKNILFEVINLQLLAFGESYKIDLWSAPIQQTGVPILCAELPKLLEDLDLESP